LLAKGDPRGAIAVLTPSLAAYDQLAAERPDDTVITEQQMRTTWMIAKAAREARLPDAAEWATKTRILHDKLRRTRTPEQMVRFDKMMKVLEKGDKS
jgi:hypothetical protein